MNTEPGNTGRTAAGLLAAIEQAGLTAELRGNPDARAARLAQPAEADEASLIFVEKLKDVPAAMRSLAAIVMLPRPALSDLIPSSGRALLGVSDVRASMPHLLALFDHRPVPAPGVHATAVVGSRVELGKNVSLGPHAVIGDGCKLGDGAIVEALASIGPGSRIGAQTRIFPGVRVYDGVCIGSRCLIHSGTVIGSDGYGYVSTAEGHHKVPQIGGVRIEDDVEIGANVTIDRGTVGDTVIGRGTKIDNLVHVAHNVRLGSHCLLIAQSGIAGSAKLGHGVVLAAQSGVAGHIEVGDRVMIGAKSGVTKSLAPAQAVSGFPARPHPEEKRIKVSLGRLPDVVRDVHRLKASIVRLSRRISSVENVSIGSA